jgi:enoyl-CoA hydratase/carnithine racemase
MSVRVRSADGIAEVVVDFPPVNALPVQGWHDLAAAVSAAGADPETRAVILAGEGRLAKRSLNGIDPVDVKRSYRYEQGFTFELTLDGAGEAARQAFVDGKRP